VSKDALKRMRQEVRGWNLTRQTHVSLTVLAKQYNPIIQGWSNYYGALYRAAMFHLYQHIDRALARWASRKFKALSSRRRASMLWLRRIKKAEPQLFHHWRLVGNEVG
jgi:RNA-directed DNA polymerase